MSIKSIDLPRTAADVQMKTFVLFERRLSRHYSSKVKLCVSCYYSCLELKGCYLDELVENILTAASRMCVTTILQQLREGRTEYFIMIIETNLIRTPICKPCYLHMRYISFFAEEEEATDEDDLYSSVTPTAESAEKVTVFSLHLVLRT